MNTLKYFEDRWRRRAASGSTSSGQMKRRPLSALSFGTSTAGRLHRDEQGSTLIYISLALMVLLGFAGLALDGSYAFSQRGRMQVAADAAALAGARLVALEKSIDDIDAQVQSIAYANGASEVSWHLINEETGIHVETHRTYKTWFAKLFGKNTVTLGAMAEAEAFSVTGVTELIPLTTMCTDAGFDEGVVYTLWNLDMNAPGSFGWVDWDGGSAGNGELAANISNPANSGTWNIGQAIPSGPAVKDSPAIRAAIRQWLGNPVTIPLYSEVIGAGHSVSYAVCGFAEFIITGYKFKGGDKWIQGMFVRNIKHGDVPPTNGADFGVKDVRLLK